MMDVDSWLLTLDTLETEKINNRKECCKTWMTFFGRLQYNVDEGWAWRRILTTIVPSN